MIKTRKHNLGSLSVQGLFALVCGRLETVQR